MSRAVRGYLSCLRYNEGMLNGTVHKTPADVGDMLVQSPALLDAWNDITPLARNEFICWITSAVKPETRVHRIEVARDKLSRGERRPCCWVGCIHREKSGK